ncbi:PxKF domain-containing protein [Actinomadura roseirufa]|uniref:PxKF domain-containing protein n=1 Tax=Actinomadura roseirufa TaxID=2094049 RepID=UPI0010415BCF|nr:PxKF domain-containing protein [Actinomadura roseirufa]
MSPSTSVPARRRGLRGRSAALIAALALTAAGLLALAGPAHAAPIEITGPADPVPAGTAYTYTVNTFLDRDMTVTADLSGAAATFTAVTEDSGDLACNASGTHAVCTAANPSGRPNPVAITLTVLPTATGTVTADATITSFSLDGSASTTTTITPAGPTYTFTGFFAPVNNPPVLNTVNAGRSIPVKFSLNGDQGLNVLADGSPYSKATTCGTGTQDPVETTTDSNSGLTYDPGTGRYTYVWKTDKNWAGTCRTFHLKLADGSDHTANFQFH